MKVLEQIGGVTEDDTTGMMMILLMREQDMAGR